MDDESVVEPWAGYLCLQNQISDRARADHTLWALEDKAGAFLDAIQQNSVPPPGDRRENWLNNLQTNRNRKHRNRLRLLERYAWQVTISTPIRNEVERLIKMERVILVRNSTSDQEFRILLRRAVDDDYKTIAVDENLTVAALKTKVSRCRQRLRSQLELRE